MALEGNPVLSQDIPVPDLDGANQILRQTSGNLSMVRRTILWLKNDEEDEELDRLHDDLLGCIIRITKVREALENRYSQHPSGRGETDITEAS